MDPRIALAAAATGYLLGSVSFARIVVRLRTGGSVAPIELTTPDGKGQLRTDMVSASAVRLQLGPKWGMLVGLLDVLKAFVPTLAFKLAFPSEPYFLIGAAAVPIGHNWPIYYRFRGGVGQSPILGGMLAIDWIGALATNGVAMGLGFTVLKDGLFADAAGVPLIIPWLWWRTGGDPWYMGYAVVVNVVYWIAYWPTVSQYLRLKREGHLPTAEDGVAMFRLDFPFMRRLSKKRYAEVDARAAEQPAGSGGDDA